MIYRPTLHETLVSKQAAIIMCQLGYDFNRAAYWITDTDIVKRSGEEVGHYLLSADVPTCTLLEAHVWLQCKYGISVQPLIKSFDRRTNTCSYDCNIFNMEKGMLEDSFVINTNSYYEALQAGITQTLITVK